MLRPRQHATTVSVYQHVNVCGQETCTDIYLSDMYTPAMIAVLERISQLQLQLCVLSG